MCARRAASPVVSCCAIRRKNGRGRGPCCSATRVGVSLEVPRLAAELMTGAWPASDTVIIRQYANRRTYTIDRSRYIPQDHLAAMTLEGGDFEVAEQHKTSSAPSRKEELQ